MRIACAGVRGNNSIVDFHVGREMQERNIFSSHSNEVGIIWH